MVNVNTINTEDTINMIFKISLQTPSLRGISSSHAISKSLFGIAIMFSRSLSAVLGKFCS